MPKFGAVYCLYDDHEYLDISLFPTSSYLDKVLFLMSDVPWNGVPADNSETIARVRQLCKDNPKFEFIQGHWTNEIDQRNFGLSVFYKQNIDYAFVIDSDEVYDPIHFQRIMAFIASNSKFDAFHVEWNTFWKKEYYCINPREHYQPVIAVNVKHFQFTIIRGGTTSVIRTGSTILKCQGDYNAILIPPVVGICFHLSYARNDEYMKRKLETNSHHNEFIPDWYDRVWATWTPQMRNLHPVTPQQYQIASKFDFANLPPQLKTFIKQEKMPQRICSIIILNWNSCSLLKRCLKLVEENTQHPHEVIVVDNGSTDDSVEYLKSVDSIKKIFNKENKGFPAGVNQAIRQTAAGSDICLLNVDAEVQEGWLEHLYDSMMANPSCGVVGPLGNVLENGYQKEGMVDRDAVVANVHGFCMLISRELLEKIGMLDERFSPGGAEDMDYCMRARLAGYNVSISAKSLVKHVAHQVYDKNGIDSETRHKEDAKHEMLYYEKYFGALLDYSRMYNLFEIPQVAQQTGIII